MLEIFTKRFHLICLLLAGVIFIITAINSHGFYHADEHYQILEFALYKNGVNQVDDLAWEFKEKMRSTILPSVAFLLITLLKALKITEPHVQAMLLRLFTGLFALFTLYKSVLFLTKKYHLKGVAQKTLVVCTYFLWFIPFLSVRFSAETYAGIVLLWVFMEVHQSNFSFKKLGVLIGLTFLFRFQMSFLLLPFLVINFWQNKTPVLLVLKVIYIFIIVVGFGILIDSWFYGDFTLSFWNYFKLVVEGILDNTENAFGSEGFLFYWIQILKAPFYPIGFILMLSMGVVLIKERTNSIIISVLFFIFIH